MIRLQDELQHRRAKTDTTSTDLIAGEPLIPPHGGYRKLRSFRVAQLAYDVTVRFCDRYIEKRSRTHDQMVQAARSGVQTGSEADTAIRWQNLAEGSLASENGDSPSERSARGAVPIFLKLTNVARASLEELRLDYGDFLRQRGLAQWPADHARAVAIQGEAGCDDGRVRGVDSGGANTDGQDGHGQRTSP